jgi:hypothetical protein
VNSGATQADAIPRAAAAIVRALRVDGGHALEGILANLDHSGHVGRHLAAGPADGLAEELKFEIIEAQGAQVRSGEIEELVALRGPLSCRRSRLVVAVQMVFVGSVAMLNALQELFGNVRIVGSGAKCRKPHSG